MQSEESARRLIDLGADPARVTVTGSLKFDSLEMPAPLVARQAARARAAVLPGVADTAWCSSPGSTMRGEEAAVLRAFARLKTTDAGRAARSSRRGSPSGSARSSGWRATSGFATVAPFRSADRRRAARRRRRARHDRRAGAALSAGDRRLRRRQPRRSRRPQHPRAGDLRQADRVRSAHAELQGDRRGVRLQRRRACRCSPSASSRRRC